MPEDLNLTTVEAEGYRTTALPARRDAGQIITLVPDTVDGLLLDAAHNSPVARATVSVGDSSTTSDADGRFSLSGVPHSRSSRSPPMVTSER